ncbi:TD and POZ domain-containing protein 4 [Halotydeus destructor]|nr:TD and POZ domain-containing protein 4 [Halotydeus destructor]
MISSEFNFFSDTLCATWTIENVHSEKSEIISPLFSALVPFDKLLWRLEFVPKAHHYSLYVRLVEPISEPDVTVRLRSAIIGCKNKAVNKRQSRDWLLFRNPEVRYGWKEFVKSKRLVSDERGYVNSDGSITLRVKITFFDSVLPTKMKHRAMSLLVKDISELVGDDTFTDIQIRVGGQVIRAKKELLTKRCSVFAAMFDAKWQEARTNVIEVHDVDFHVMETLIHYLHTGVLNRLMDNRFAVKLFTAADKYNLDLLKRSCEQFIVDGLADSCLIEALLVGYLHDSDRLKESCLNYVVSSSQVDHITQFESWNLLYDYPKLITLVIDRCTIRKVICNSTL